MLEWDCAADTGIFNVLAIACLGCESISDPSRCWMEWTWMTCRSLPKLMGSEVACKYYSGTLVMLNIFPLLRWILVQATLAYVLILIMSITTWLMGEWPPRPPLVLSSKAPLPHLATQLCRALPAIFACMEMHCCAGRLKDLPCWIGGFFLRTWWFGDQIPTDHKMVA